MREQFKTSAFFWIHFAELYSFSGLNCSIRSIDPFFLNPFLSSFNFEIKSGPSIWYWSERRIFVLAFLVTDSGEATVELEAEVDAEHDAEDAPLRAKNCFTPARCISCGVQNVLTFDWTWAYLLLDAARFGVETSSSGFDGVRKLRVFEFVDGKGSFWVDAERVS